MDWENTVCSFYKIERSCLYSSDSRRSRAETEGLHFVWYLRHYVEGLSIRVLATTYKKHERTVKHGIAKIKGYILYDPRYKDIHQKLLGIKD